MILESNVEYETNYLQPIFKLIDNPLGFVNNFFNAVTAVEHTTTWASDTMAGGNKFLEGKQLRAVWFCCLPFDGGFITRCTPGCNHDPISRCSIWRMQVYSEFTHIHYRSNVLLNPWTKCSFNKKNLRTTVDSNRSKMLTKENLWLILCHRNFAAAVFSQPFLCWKYPSDQWDSPGLRDSESVTAAMIWWRDDEIQML